MNIYQIQTKLKESKKKVFSTSDIAKISQFTGKEDSLHVLVQRMKKKGLIQSIKRDLFFVSEEKLTFFQIANVLYSPSYISLESALNYYGILIQVPSTVRSIGVKRAKKVLLDEKNYEYFNMNKNYYFGYLEINGFLIADKEKALIDQIYFTALSKTNTSFEELQLENIDFKKLKRYASKIKNKAFQKLFSEFIKNYF